MPNIVNRMWWFVDILTAPFTTCFNLYLNIIDDVSKQTSTSTLLSTSTSTSIFPTTASFNLYLNINTYCQHQHQTGNQHVIITINIKINNQHHQGRAGWGQCSTPGKQAGHLHEQGGTHASTGQNDGHRGDGDGDGDLYRVSKKNWVLPNWAFADLPRIS